MSTSSSDTVLETARQAVNLLANEPGLGLNSANSIPPDERVLSVEDTVSGRRLRILSDGMTLDQKLSFERSLLIAMDDAKTPIASIYFQRSPGTSGALSGAAPAPIKRKSSPFGLTIDKKAIPGVRQVILVASGKGGVGKSTVSANLAVGLSSLGKRVGLLDCDVYGPSAPILLGVRGEMPMDPKGKLLPLEGHGVKVVSFGFLSDARTPVIWRGPLVAKAIEQLCYDVSWGDLDFLIVDLPPGTGDVQLTLAERLPIHGAVIVTTPQDVALIDAHKAVSMFERLEVPIIGVVENMAWYACTKCGHEEHIFGDEAFQEFLKTRSLRLLTRIPLSRDVRERSDRGTPPVLTEALAAPYLSLASQVRDQFELLS